MPKVKITDSAACRKFTLGQRVQPSALGKERFGRLRQPDTFATVEGFSSNPELVGLKLDGSKARQPKPWSIDFWEPIVEGEK